MILDRPHESQTHFKDEDGATISVAAWTGGTTVFGGTVPPRVIIVPVSNDITAIEGEDEIRELQRLCSLALGEI